MRFGWVNKLPIILLLSFCHSLLANNSPNYCQFSYRIAEDSVLCARARIEPSNVINKIKLTERLYNSYTGVSVKVSGIYVIILTSKEMNDPSLFPNVRTYSAAARYFPKQKMLYITKEALESGNTDFAHELVHHLNQKRGVKNAAEDEEIAYLFEEIFSEAY